MSFYFGSCRSGIPDAEQIEIMSKFISPELYKLLQDANRAEICHAERVHNLEPPLWGGDLFTSLFEGATEGKIITVRVDGKSAESDVEWIDDAKDGQQAVVWQDKFSLVMHNDAWRIDDIAHLVDWEFTFHGRISELLHDISGQCQDESG